MPNQVSSPYVYDSGLDANGKRLAITVTFDNTTRVITAASLFRDTGCLYTKLFIGIGSDGRPDTTTRTFTVQTGTHAVTAAQLVAIGLPTIEDFLSYQITAGF